jgi:hypothetical protein
MLRSSSFRIFVPYSAIVVSSEFRVTTAGCGLPKPAAPQVQRAPVPPPAPAPVARPAPPPADSDGDGCPMQPIAARERPLARA